MLQALKLKGNHMFAFTSVPGKGIIDLTPVSKTFMPVNWKDLEGKIINNKHVILTRFGDIHPFPNNPVFNCETVFIDGCDKNFVAYWLNDRTFPKAKTVYLASHPCDSYVLHRKFDHFYVHESYENYRKRWGGDNIKSISADDYKSLMNKYEENSEEMQLKE